MLSGSERQRLKARAYKLEPVVLVGGKGLTDEGGEGDRHGAEGAPAGVGKVFVLYRKNDEAR